MGAIYLRKYGVQTTIDFALYELDGTDLVATAAYAAGDVKIMKDEGAEANTTNSFTDEGSTYSIVLTATEMQAARIVLILIDQTAPKVWLDRALYIETYGHASGQHAFDLATATVNLSAASEAQIDAIETDTNEVQGKLPTNKIMGSSVVTDKDDEIDAIKTMTDKIGTVTNTGGTATIGAVLGDFANSALVTRVATVDTVLDNVHDTDLPAVKTDTTAILKISGNRWKISTVANTLTIYNDDGVTPLYVFNLKDSIGNAASTNVFERVPV